MKLFNSWRIQIPNHVDIVQRILFDGLSTIRPKRSSEGRWKLEAGNASALIDKAKRKVADLYVSPCYQKRSLRCLTSDSVICRRDDYFQSAAKLEKARILTSN